MCMSRFAGSYLPAVLSITEDGTDYLYHVVRDDAGQLQKTHMAPDGLFRIGELDFSQHLLYIERRAFVRLRA